jgi:hypothetical protein
MESKLKHLDICQNVISRMAGDSFLLKGWSVTLVAALLALTAKDGNPHFAWVALLPSIIFWLLDAYYLRQERLFRALYDSVRSKPENQIDFSLDTSLFGSSVESLARTAFSASEIPFYGALIVTVAVVILITSCHG